MDPANQSILVIVLDHGLLVDEDELRDDRAGLQPQFGVQIRNVADDEVPAVEGDGVPRIDQTPHVVRGD